MVKFKSVLAILLMLAFIAAFIGSARAQAVAQKVNDQDKEWLRSAVIGSEYEILGGTMAQTHAKYLSTRQFGAVLVIDHMNTFNAEVDTAVLIGGVKLDYRINGAQNESLQRLQPRLGRPFDLLYLQIEINDHKQDIADARKEVRDGRDPDVRDLAAKEIPLLQRHLDLAVAIYNSIVSGGNGRGFLTQEELNLFFAPEPLPTTATTPAPTPKP